MFKQFREKKQIERALHFTGKLTGFNYEKNTMTITIGQGGWRRRHITKKQSFNADIV